MKNIFKSFNRLATILILSTVLFSCNNDNEPDSLFEDTPTGRLDAQAKELSQLLQSSPNGWEMTYFTDDPRYTDIDQQLGGWSFVFKFTDDRHVTMASDFSEETLTPKESEYEIQLGSTTKLTFTTGSYIHMLSDGRDSPTSALAGEGYKGDFQFLYYGQEGENLIFRSNRSQIEIRFKKASAQAWSDLEEDRETGNILSSAGNFELEISEGGEITTYENFSYNPSTRFATNTVTDSLSFGVAYRPNGIKVVKPIQVGSEQATDFTYDATNNWFISELANGNYAKILLGDPILVSDIVNDYYFGVLAVSGHPLNDSSDDFIDLFIDSRDTLEEETGASIYGFFIVPDFGFVQYLLIDEDDNIIDPRPNRIISSYSVDDTDGTLTLVDGGWQNAGDSVYDVGLQAINDILFDPEGLKIVPSGAFYDGDPVFFLENDAGISIGSNGIAY